MQELEPGSVTLRGSCVTGRSTVHLFSDSHPLAERSTTSAWLGHPIKLLSVAYLIVAQEGTVLTRSQHAG